MLLGRVVAGGLALLAMHLASPLDHGDDQRRRHAEHRSGEGGGDRRPEVVPRRRQHQVEQRGQGGRADRRTEPLPGLQGPARRTRHLHRDVAQRQRHVRRDHEAAADAAQEQRGRHGPEDPLGRRQTQHDRRRRDPQQHTDQSDHRQPPAEAIDELAAEHG